MSSASSVPSDAGTPVPRRDRAGLHAAAGSLGFGLLGVGAAWGGSEIGLFSLGAPAPGLFPFCFGVLLAAVAAASLVVDLTRHARARPGVPAGADDEPAAPGGNRRVVGYLAVGIGCALAMTTIGFVPAALVSVLALVRGVERMPWRLSLLVTAGSVLVAYLLFARLLAVPLPRIPI